MSRFLRPAAPTFAAILFASFALTFRPVLAETRDPAPKVATQSAQALPVAEVARVMSALRLEEMLTAMREEGIASALEVEDSMFPGEGGDAWAKAVDSIYDQVVMRDTLTETLSRELANADIDAMTAFFEKEPGKTILDLELAARKAMQEPETEELALRRLDEMRLDGGPRMESLQAFVAANDLIATNVTGAMNSSLAFSMGLHGAGSLPYEMSDDEIVAEVWAQEDSIRAETTDWIYSYLLMAYEPLSDANLASYIAFSESPAGQKLNAALFAAFDAVYVRQSHELGKAAARFVSGEEI